MIFRKQSILLLACLALAGHNNLFATDQTSATPQAQQQSSALKTCWRGVKFCSGGAVLVCGLMATATFLAESMKNFDAAEAGIVCTLCASTFYAGGKLIQNAYYDGPSANPEPTEERSEPIQPTATLASTQESIAENAPRTAKPASYYVGTATMGFGIGVSLYSYGKALLRLIATRSPATPPTYDASGLYPDLTTISSPSASPVSQPRLHRSTIAGMFVGPLLTYIGYKIRNWQIKQEALTLIVDTPSENSN